MENKLLQRLSMINDAITDTLLTLDYLQQHVGDDKVNIMVHSSKPPHVVNTSPELSVGQAILQLLIKEQNDYLQELYKNKKSIKLELCKED